MTRSLRSRWLVSYLILILVTAVILDVVVSRSLRGYLIRQIQNHLQDNLVLIQDLVKNSPLDSSLDMTAKQISRKLNARVTFINSNGVVLGDSDVPEDKISEMENHRTRPEVITAFSGATGQSIRHSATLKTDMLYVAIPWQKDGKIQGVIRMALPLIHVEEILGENRRWIYIGSLIAVLAAVFIEFYFANTITRPIRQMVMAAQQIAQEKFSQKIKIESYDELKTLAESLNTMSTKLESRFRTIQEEKQQLETILSSMTEGVMVLDNKGKITLTNSPFKKMLDLTVDPIGRSPMELIRNPEITEALMGGLKTGKPFQKEIILAGNGSKVIRLYAAPLQRNGVVEGLVTVFHDISDLRTLEQIRRDFVANVSHELRTPLTTVHGFAETLLDGALLDKEVSRKFVENIYSQTQRMTELVEDLLCLSRIESGKAEMKFEFYNLIDSLESAMDILSPKASRQKIEIQTLLPLKPVMVMGDRRYIEQMLTNLLDNAVKFSNPPNKVLAEIRDMEQEVEIKISDSGVGIPSEDLPRIFERFYRVDKSRSVEIEGTGLGLAIVKHIVDAHRGTICVESTLGKGTTFIVTLPKTKV